MTKISMFWRCFWKIRFCYKFQ